MTELRKMQLCQLQILKAVVKVCDENKIDYLLACGSLLGAVRHQGFIPWDDDIDIYMTVENYRRFCKIGQKCLGEKYFVQNWRTEKEYSELWTQVRMNGTTSLPVEYKNWNIHFGIHIDIFPIVGIADDKRKAQKQKQYVQICKSFLAVDCMKATGEKAMGRQKMINLIPRFARRTIVSIFEKKAFLSPSATSFCAELWVDLRRHWPSNWAYNFTSIEFEREWFKTTAYYEDYLTTMYGDYMTPPPEKNRVGHENFIGTIIKDTEKDYRVYKQELYNDVHVYN